MVRKTVEKTGAVLTCTKCGDTFDQLAGDYWKKKGERCPRCVREVDRDRIRADSLERNCRRHGITVEDYSRLLARQGGGCAICSARPEPRGEGRHRPNDVLHVDHDHATGRVRGLLCHGCNCAIGFMEDDTDRLLAAVAYLKTR